MPRFIPTLLSTILLATLVLTGAAQIARADTGFASIIVDAETGAVLSEEQATRRWYPASLTKLMTLYLTFEAIENGTLALDDTLTVSDNAAAQPEVSLHIRAGAKITVEQAIIALIVRSANDIATLLAETVGGSEPRFAAMMSLKARALGMSRTVFRNASGLPDDSQITSARDMAMLAAALIEDFPAYYEYFSRRQVLFDGQSLGTYNQFLDYYEGADGFKTGFTCGSGYNLVASAVHDGRRLIGVVLGGDSGGQRTAEMARLMDEAFAAPVPANPILLADWPNAVAGEDSGPPPFRLPPDQCELGASAVADGTLDGGTLPGWGVVFGAYVEKAQAEAVLMDAREQLKDILSKGRPAVVQREQEGVSRYSALMVGLAREDAGKACKFMWDQSAYCLALSPEVLNNPQALWR
ncbi:MAG: D-alanyl-D-alanine carboxypeptidase family protein [Dongiaceae bacterium]